MRNFIKRVLVASAIVCVLLGLNSCGSGRQYLVIPHSVSTASAVSVDNLNLAKGDYDVLNTITETASILCEYKGKQIRISGDSGAFYYIFEQTKMGSWVLKSFEGAAALGYFTADLVATDSFGQVPDAEEFARRVAMARIIKAAKDYQADGVVEPIVVSRASNAGKNKIEYSATVSAKLIVIRTTRSENK